MCLRRFPAGCITGLLFVKRKFRHCSFLCCSQIVHTRCYLKSALCYPMACYAMLCYSMLCSTMLCDATLCPAMLCYVMLSYVMLYVMVWYGRVWYVMVSRIMLHHFMSAVAFRFCVRVSIVSCFGQICYVTLCYVMLCQWLCVLCFNCAMATNGV